MARVTKLGLTGSPARSADRALWRIPSNIAQGTAVHAMLFSGSANPYALVSQANVTVGVGGAVDIPLQGFGNVGDKALAFVHNFDGNTSTTSIYGGAGIATVTLVV